jgi:Fur family ferric uptake transcriptional regulator
MDASVQQRFEKFIRGKGLRRTPQRDAILRCVFSGDEHFTAEELWDRVRRTNNRSSRATVYRTLSLLVDAGLLREIDLGGELTTYDPNFLDRPSHNHLVCVDCGKVIEFEDSHVELLNDCLTRRLGFQPVRQSLRIEACCEKLRSSGTCPNLIQARLSGKRLPSRKR